ncbi:MAG: 8-amino-7-oxononanoate synthase [Candidatus Loosdrechtia sp.]|uniref:aminotransferase class I/II-fold pyridoxal phosphate-dependent enzyme n=1 Tax=Candidatus Loosdrechtia sp. TaxID=3101272 RepID=UPI003A6174B5|nr:MAG: 8-amino-7-oxononanoate synthase [Candidatus Jettenia sp. AMX2]
MIDFVSDELQVLKDRALMREYRTIEGPQDRCIQIEGKSYLSFCSNNYLGLANHPKIKQAVIDAIHQYGWGAGASRLVSGNMKIHQELERKIAEFKGTEAALLFPTGYMANVGSLCSLVTKGDIVIGDKLNHASIIDGCRQSGATFRIYPHKMTNYLESLLQKSSMFRRRLIVTDSVFSMDGDTAPLPEIVGLARKYDAIVMIDDAHATGVFGQHGKGIAEYYNLEGKVDIVMGSLSKAVGSVGGFIAGSRHLIEFLKNKARSFMYTTALPPAVCAASLTGLILIQENAFLVKKLWENIDYIKCRLSEFTRITVESPIIPVVAGTPEDALCLSLKLFKNGIVIPAIRPPTVPSGTSRLRISLMATHNKNDIDKLLDTLKGTGFLKEYAQTCMG